MNAALEVTTGAYQRTRGAATARIELSRELTGQVVPPMSPPVPQPRRDGLLRSAAKAAAERFMSAVLSDVDLHHRNAEGVIDLPGIAHLSADGTDWTGRSGHPLSTLPRGEPEMLTPLWLVDILSGLTGATERGVTDIRGVSCRCYDAIVDLRRASKAMPNGIAVPAVGRFEDLLALSVEVCVDPEYVRRVHVSTNRRNDMLELWDFGLSLDTLDWSRLPTLSLARRRSGARQRPQAEMNAYLSPRHALAGRGERLLATHPLACACHRRDGGSPARAQRRRGVHWWTDWGLAGSQ